VEVAALEGRVEVDGGGDGSELALHEVGRDAATERPEADMD
jgi:hypothetical protein